MSGEVEKSHLTVAGRDVVRRHGKRKGKVLAGSHDGPAFGETRLQVGG